MSNALRERLEALANSWWPDGNAEPFTDARVAAKRHARELREALTAPADVPPLPSGWKAGGTFTRRHVAAFYGDERGIWIMDDGTWSSFGKVTVVEAHAVLAHHLARHGGGT